MSKTIKLDTAEMKALCQLGRQVIAKFTESITLIRSINTDLDPILAGGQGETIKGLVTNLGSTLTKLQTCIRSLNQKISAKEASITQMEGNKGKFANVDEIIAAATAKANRKAQE